MSISYTRKIYSLPGGSSGVPPGPYYNPGPNSNYYFVSATIGNDATAQVGNDRKPWLNFNTAMAAASSGDTIVVLTDLAQATPFTIKNGVNIAGASGQMILDYTSNTANAAMADAGVAMVFNISNIKVTRSGTFSSIADGAIALTSTTSVVTCNNTVFNGGSNTGAYIAGKLINAECIGNTQYALYTLSTGSIINCTATNLGNNIAIYNIGTAIDCYAYSTGAFTAFYNEGSARKCFGRGDAGAGFYSYSTSTFTQECTGISIDVSGLLTLNTNISACVGISTNYYGITLDDLDANTGNVAADCYGYSVEEAAFGIFGHGLLHNCTGISLDGLYACDVRPRTDPDALIFQARQCTFYCQSVTQGVAVIFFRTGTQAPATPLLSVSNCSLSGNNIAFQTAIDSAVATTTVNYANNTANVDVSINIAQGLVLSVSDTFSNTIDPTL